MRYSTLFDPGGRGRHRLAMDTCGHVVHGDGNVFVSGGSGTVVVDARMLERQAGGQIIHGGGGREVLRRVQRVVGRRVAHAEEAQEDNKLLTNIRPVATCLVIVTSSILTACIELASSSKFKKASIGLLACCLSLSPILLVVIFSKHNNTSSTDKNMCAMAFLFLFLYLSVSIGMFMGSRLVQLHPAIASSIGCLLMMTMLVFWGCNYAYPKFISNAMTCYRNNGVALANQEQLEREEEQEQEMPERAEREQQAGGVEGGQQAGGGEGGQQAGGGEREHQQAGGVEGEQQAGGGGGEHEQEAGGAHGELGGAEGQQNGVHHENPDENL